MKPSDWQDVARSVHASGRKLVIAATGGGTGAISALVQTPGASRTVLEAVVPYSLRALVDWIGGVPDQACSEATARAMAMAAFMRARALAPDAEPAALVGVGFSGSLATDRAKRGERRVHVATQTATRTWAGGLSLDATPPDRSADERLATEVLLTSLAGGCGIDASRSGLRCAGGVGEDASNSLSDLLLGARRCVIASAGGRSQAADDATVAAIKLVFPGAFNPRHAGHLRMAEIAERRLATPAAWELSIANVDKPPLDFLTLRERVDPLAFDDPPRTIVLTRAATFREKAAIFPGATFIVGADTIARIGEPRYYGGDFAARDTAIEDIARQGCRFLVFGREADGRFQTLGGLALPERLRALCDGAPESEFREDVSSTQLRASRE